MKQHTIAAIVLIALTALLLLPAGCDTSSAAVNNDQFTFEAGASARIMAAPPATPLPQPLFFPGLPNQAVEVRLPVLMYHHVGEPAADASDLTRRLTVSTAQFEEQMSYLQQAGYKTVSQDQLYRAMYYGEPLPAKPVMLTLDDGFLDNYEVAAPILGKYGHRATFFIITDKVGVLGYMNWDQVVDLERMGMDIGSHTVSHPDLTILGAAGLERELIGSAVVINEKLGHPVYWLCYPSGAFNKGVWEHTWSAGYLSAFTTMPGEIHHTSYSLVQPRWRVGPGTGIEQFIRLVD